MSAPSSSSTRLLLATSSFLLAAVVPPAPRAAAQEPVPGARATPLLTDTTVGHERAPVARVVLGTVIGGIALGSPGLTLMLAPCHEILCSSQLIGAAAAATGYVAGSALGARYAASVHGARPPAGRIVLASFLSAVAGGIVWNRVGEAFEPDEPGPTDYSSWQLGAAAGAALHIAVTSLVALRAPLVAPPPVPAPPPPAPATTLPPAPATHSPASAPLAPWPDGLQHAFFAPPSGASSLHVP